MTLEVHVLVGTKDFQPCEALPIGEELGVNVSFAIRVMHQQWDAVDIILINRGLSHKECGINHNGILS